MALIENKETLAALSTLAFLGTTSVNASADAQIKSQEISEKTQKSGKRFRPGGMVKFYGGPSFRNWSKQVIVDTLKSNTDEGKTDNKEKDFKNSVEGGNSAEQKATILEKTNSSEGSKKLDETKNSTLKDTAGSNNAREKKVIKKPPIVVKDGVEGFWDWEGSGWPSGWNTDTYVSEEGSVSVCFYGGPPIFRTKEEYEERYGKVDSNEQKSEEEVKKKIIKI